MQVWISLRHRISLRHKKHIRYPTLKFGRNYGGRTMPQHQGPRRAAVDLHPQLLSYYGGWRRCDSCSISCELLAITTPAKLPRTTQSTKQNVYSRESAGSLESLHGPKAILGSAVFLSASLAHRTRRPGRGGGAAPALGSASESHWLTARGVKVAQSKRASWYTGRSSKKKHCLATTLMSVTKGPSLAAKITSLVKNTSLDCRSSSSMARL